MAHLTYEIVKLPASRAYQEDQSIVKPAFDISRIRTPHTIWLGLQTDEPNFWNISTWDSSSTHRAFQASAEYSTFFSLMKPAFLDSENPRAEFMYAHFDRDPACAFNASITEIALLTPKDGATRADVEDAIGNLFAALREDDSDGIDGYAVGSIEESTEKVIFVVGRKSGAQQKSWASPSGSGGSAIGGVMAVCNAIIVNVKLSTA